MSPKARSVYYLRDALTPDGDMKNQYNQMKDYGSDMTKYLKDGNEARIRSVYDGRDPRMEMNFIVPYGTYKGGCTADCYTYTLRFKPAINE